MVQIRQFFDVVTAKSLCFLVHFGLVRRFDNQRHMGRAFQEGHFCSHMVISHHIAVIRSKDNIGIIHQIQFPQTGEQKAQTVINLCDTGIIGAFHSTLLFWGKAMDVIQHESALQEAFRHGFKVL